MLQQYDSLVVDASFINKNFTQVSVIGKGRDFYLGISSISYLMHHTKEQGRFILQVYENLGHDIFRVKVLQLQKAMLECINDINSRIILIGEKQLNDKQSDLYVLYQIDDPSQKLDKLKGLTSEQAKELLITFCKNLLITGRVTYEYLDLAPQNIYIENNRFVISNMGISYKGSKFHRPYIPITDSFNKEKNLANMIYSYSFQAGLVILCAATQIESSEFFFEDGQLKSKLLQEVLQVFREKQKDQEILKLKLKKKFASLSKIEKPFDVDLSNIIHPLSLMLSLDQQKRSIFTLLICHPENPLKVEHPFFQQSLDVEQQYVGFGKLEANQIIPQGYGHGKFGNEYHYGMFSNGSLTDDGTIEIKQQNNIIYILKNLVLTQKFQQAIAEYNKYIYWGEFDNKQYKPNGDGILLNVFTNQKQLPKKKQQIYFQGTFLMGVKQEGQEYYKNKSEFDGKFKNNKPFDGQITYGPRHIFQGIVQDYKRIKGTLLYRNQQFEGDFENDKIKQGKIKFSDGSQYEGQFKDGLKCCQEGKFTYGNNKLEYLGGFQDDRFHGKGTLTLLESKEQQEVEYQNGKCLTKLQEPFIVAMKMNQNTEIKQQEVKKSKEQKENNDEEGIEEDIQDGFGEEGGEYEDEEN